METKELIDILQVCADHDIICPACPRYEKYKYGGTAECYEKLMLEAADTIESQQKRIAELEAALREQEERRWIPVAERLPEIGRKCLIANREIVVRGWLRPDGVWKTGVSSDEVWSKFSLFPPTHWMPLPEPPKEDA